jgi:hypothetical protein
MSYERNLQEIDSPGGGRESAAAIRAGDTRLHPPLAAGLADREVVGRGAGLPSNQPRLQQSAYVLENTGADD